jgi:hypothetical protein
MSTFSKYVYDEDNNAIGFILSDGSLVALPPPRSAPLLATPAVASRLPTVRPLYEQTLPAVQHANQAMGSRDAYESVSSVLKRGKNVNFYGENQSNHEKQNFKRYRRDENIPRVTGSSSSSYIGCAPAVSRKPEIRKPELLKR